MSSGVVLTLDTSPSGLLRRVGGIPAGFGVARGKTQIRVPEMTVVGADRGTPPRVGYRSVIVRDSADGTLYLDEPVSLLLLDAPSRDSEDPDATPSAFVNAASWCFVARRNASLP